MNLVSDLDLPVFDYSAPDFSADRYHRQLAEFFGVTGGPLADHIDANILNLTGEQHRRLRALVGPAFTPRRADRWRPVMRGFLEDLWSQSAPNSSCDFVAAVA